MIALDVWLDDRLVGLLEHDAGTNLFRFGYAAAWIEGAKPHPISPQLPLRDARPAESHSATVRQFFENLLPEGEALDHAAQAANVSKSNLVGLLVALGGETSGAVRVTLSGGPSAARAEELRPVTQQQLSKRIRARRNEPFSVWDGRVRLSIAGFQDKIAVYAQGGNTYLVDGPRLASTFIVKPPPVQDKLAALPFNEYTCMQLARRMGLAVPETRLIGVPEPVLLVRRFDRRVADGRVQRLHVVDGCQALGHAVAMKYERNYGDAPDVRNIRDGVSLPRLFALLDAHSPAPIADRIALLRWAIFQVLVGNTDAHGKNVSFFYGEGGLRIAPAYDLVAVQALDAGLSATYAMAIGDSFLPGELSPYEWAHFGHLCGIPFRVVAKELQGMAERLLACIDELSKDVGEAGVPAAVAGSIANYVKGQSSRHLGFAPKVALFKTSDFA